MLRLFVVVMLMLFAALILLAWIVVLPVVGAVPVVVMFMSFPIFKFELEIFVFVVVSKVFSLML